MVLGNTFFAFIISATLVFSTISKEWCFAENPYATHQPVLYYAASITDGPIIEFGCGEGSTDMLHELCRSTNRLLISLDDDLSWINRFKEKYLGDGYTEDNTGWHRFYYVPGKASPQDGDRYHDPKHWVDFWNANDFLKSLSFDLCFIDQSPWLARYETIKMLKGKSKLFIVHDCDYFPQTNVFGKVIEPLIPKSKPGVYDFSDTFKYFRVYFPNLPWPGETGPPTLLASDEIQEFPDIDFPDYQ